jgi:MFS family permease
MLHSDLHYPLAFLVVGLLLLLAGRRLFWLLVAVAGFVAGVEAVPYLLPHQGELFTLVVGLALGLLGALLAFFLQKIAIAIAGFAGGGYLAVIFFTPLLGAAAMNQPASWICFLVGGIIGALLMNFFFNWALMILSSLEGAHIILKQLIPERHQYFVLLLAGLAFVGIIIQASMYRRPARVAEE